MPERRPSVFIGSSVEGLSIAKAIQVNLNHACQAVVWSQGVFGLGGGALESLVDRLDTFDFAILVVTPDDMVASRGVVQPAPRDNVLLELGLFIGALGRKRSFMVWDRSTETKLPSDLAGTTLADFELHDDGNLQASLGPCCTQIEDAIAEYGIRTDPGTDHEVTALAKWGIIDLRRFHDGEGMGTLLSDCHDEVIILKTWFPEDHNIARGLKDAMKNEASIELILCAPESKILGMRSRSAGIAHTQATNWIRIGLDVVAQTVSDGKFNGVAFYNAWPGCPVIWADGRTFMGFYFRGHTSPHQPWVEVRPESPLLTLLEEQRDSLRTLAREAGPSLNRDGGTIDKIDKLHDWVKANPPLREEADA